MLELKIDGFTYKDLHDQRKLEELDARFLAYLAQADGELSARFRAYRDGAELSAVEESAVIVDSAEHLSAFVAALFGVEAEVEEHRRGILSFGPIWAFKKEFLGKRVKRVKDGELEDFDVSAFDKCVAAIIEGCWDETPRPADHEAAFASVVNDLVASLDDCDADLLSRVRRALAGKWDGPAEDPAYVKALLDDVARWCKLRSADASASEITRGWVGFKQPERIDFENLVRVERPDPEMPALMAGPAATRRRRDGFKLTDRRYSEKETMAEVDYCILCHERDRDTCAKGFFGKDGELAKNPVGITLTGCPLDEKISEFHMAQARGDSLAALATVMIDNPMVPGTGHRICNDCMKACIYQKFEPVNIPQIETRVLTDVLDLPWGFEIYCLLTRWNPLNRKRPVMKPYNGKNVLVVGLGPAGYTLAHFLMSEGFGVVGIDGLKMEPLAEGLAGDADSPPVPVKNFADLYQELDERALMGFGGVAEYGITVRWDKNFLKVVRICLERRNNFRAYGGVRFGGTLDIDDAWELGFDHIAIATGAGKPTILDMKNNLCRGIRKASDFLMGLQLTGAQKKDSMTNLQVRLPALVIGGGLTAIDTSTELMAYYPLQVEKTLDRYEALAAAGAEDELRSVCSAEDLEILDEFLSHGREVRKERERAAAAGEDPDFAPLVKSWGGATMVYRKSMRDSPAYRLNHEEIIKALEEGIDYIETLSPLEALTDKYGALDGVVFERQVKEQGRWRGTGETLALPARSMFVAAGTAPNVIYERERPGTFSMDKWDQFYSGYYLREQGGKRVLEADKGGNPQAPGMFTSYESEGRYISFFGDNHPVYAGNVVRAMASARDGYEDIVALFSEDLAALDEPGQDARDAQWKELAGVLDDGLVPSVHEVKRLTPTIVEVFVRAPFAARRFKPGQFYRIQNFESTAPRVEGTVLAAEGMALTGAWVDKDKGLLSTIVLEMGGSSRLCATWRKGDPIVAMGPTGEPTAIPENQTVLLLGGGLGNAVQFSIGKAMREAGNRVIYFAAYKKPEDVYHVDDIEAASDIIIWSVDGGEPIKPRRPQDRSFVGNILQAMEAYARGELGGKEIELSEADRLIAIGSDRMMAAVKAGIHGQLEPYLKKGIVGIGSINSTMQCMMKEICAQCLQKHVDPQTGEETKPVFTCFNQDQLLDAVDFDNLNSRLRSNSLLEKIGNRWLTYLLERSELPRV